VVQRLRRPTLANTLAQQTICHQQQQQQQQQQSVAVITYCGNALLLESTAFVCIYAC
jgi:hypothetical protein